MFEARRFMPKKKKKKIIMELLFIVGQYARVNLIFFHNLINVI